MENKKGRIAVCSKIIRLLFIVIVGKATSSWYHQPQEKYILKYHNTQMLAKLLLLLAVAFAVNGIHD